MNIFERAKAEIEKALQKSDKQRPPDPTTEAKLLLQKYERNELLIEQRDVAQNQGEPFRRIFNSNNSQFTIWYSSENLEVIIGIQVSYGMHTRNHVVTKLPDGSLSFTLADDDTRLLSPILMANGEFVAEIFREYTNNVTAQLPHEVAEYLDKVMEEMDKKKYRRYPL